MTTTYSQLVEDLSNHAGTDRQRAQRALGAVLGVLGERLDRGVARELAAAIPHEAGEHLLAGEPIGEFDVATFYERVSRRLQLDVGVGMFVNGDDGLRKVSLDDWTGRLKPRAADAPAPKVKSDIRVLDIDGNAAVARIKVWRDGKFLFTDYMPRSIDLGHRIDRPAKH